MENYLKFKTFNQVEFVLEKSYTIYFIFKGENIRVLGSQIDRAPRLTVFRKGWLTFPAF